MSLLRSVLCAHLALAWVPMAQAAEPEAAASTAPSAAKDNLAAVTPDDAEPVLDLLVKKGFPDLGVDYDKAHCFTKSMHRCIYSLDGLFALTLSAPAPGAPVSMAGVSFDPFRALGATERFNRLSYVHIQVAYRALAGRYLDGEEQVRYMNALRTAMAGQHTVVEFEGATATFEGGPGKTLAVIWKPR